MHNDIEIIPIPAFEDNYIWLLHNASYALVVDPGDAKPVLDKLSEMRLTLTHILITHHHADHIGGVESLIKAFPNAKVFAPKKEQYEFKHTPVSEPDSITLEEYNYCGAPLQFSIIDLPGHTIGHIAYYVNTILFCGDTLFGAGCGRLFEGTYSQMYHSLQKLACLPKETNVFCTHEYTIKNLSFALTIEPNNEALQKRFFQVTELREQKKPSLPSDIATELATNPFLRCDVLVTKNDSVNKEEKTALEIELFKTIRLKRNLY